MTKTENKNEQVELNKVDGATKESNLVQLYVNSPPTTNIDVTVGLVVGIYKENKGNGKSELATFVTGIGSQAEICNMIANLVDDAVTQFLDPRMASQLLKAIVMMGKTSMQASVLRAMLGMDEEEKQND